MPPKVYVPAYPAGDVRAMPALGGGYAALKWVTSFPRNRELGLPTAGGLVLLSDAENGRLVAILDAAAVTWLRTGAAAVLAAETLGRDDAETAAVDYVTGNEGLLMAPAYALPRMLERQGMALQDFDLVEIHEAFASTVLATLAAWEDAEFCRDRLGLSAPIGALDRSRLNVGGSSLAAGHPFAATGGRIVASLAKLLQEKGSGSRGLISICAAGGQGVMAILEAA